MWLPFVVKKLAQSVEHRQIEILEASLLLRRFTCLFSFGSLVLRLELQHRDFESEILARLVTHLPQVIVIQL